MQQRPENDLVYCLTILEAAGKISRYLQGFTNPEAFFKSNDQVYFNASLLLIATIGDHVNKISNSTKLKFKSIPWTLIKNTRNRIVHDYVGVDYEIVFDIATTEVTDLKCEIEKLIKIQIEDGVFLKDEIIVAAKSQWYNHVDFSQFDLNER